MSGSRFPPGFVWGVATSAFQIEGAAESDGRGESIWDRFACVPGRIEDHTDGKTACDHYRLWKEDVDLIASIGAKAYRFSIAWPRLFPEGGGSLNATGLSFYDRLVDRLLDRGIEPFATLYHWDLPQVLQDRGGWADRDTALAFGDYAFEAGRHLGDRVKYWVTQNEPWCAAMLGHDSGEHAPGLKNRGIALAAGHHLLLSHGLAVTALRQSRPDAEVGITHVICPGHSASESEADRRATQAFDEDFNRWFVEPTALGRYPHASIERYLERGIIDQKHPVLARPDDLRIIGVQTDFFAFNYYTRAIIRADVAEVENEPRTLAAPLPESQTDMDWEVYPSGLYEVLKRASSEWMASKIFITECGAAYGDGPQADERIRDERRVRFLNGHFQQAHRALSEGVPLAGLFVWSLLDNFEWAFGYTKRFGIVWVDFETQKRIPKDSAHWFRQVAQSNELP